MLQAKADPEITTTDPAVIPDAQWFVVATDTFLSGWGVAEGATNVVAVPILPGQNESRIMDNLARRGDMARVRVVTRETIHRYASRSDVLASLYGTPERPVPEQWLEGA